MSLITLDDVVFKSGYYSQGVPHELAKSFLDADLYEDKPKRMFKRRWSDPEKYLGDDKIHFFGVAYHNDNPVGVAHGHIKHEYTMYELESGNYAIAEAGLGVYVKPQWRYQGLGQDLLIRVLEKMEETRGDEKPGVRMAVNARQLPARIVSSPRFCNQWITLDDMAKVVDRDLPKKD